MNIIYIRTSTEEQTPEIQLKDCKSINKWGDYDLFEEQKSAWKIEEDRDEFEKVKKLIQKGEVDHLVVWDLDRVYRNRKRLAEFFEFCKHYKCKIHSFRQPWLEEMNSFPEPWNEIIMGLMIQILGWISEEESNKKSARVKLAMRKKDDGIYSYKGNKWGRKMLPKKVRQVIISLHEQGLKMRDIQSQTYYYDSSRNKKGVSLGVVHKIISEHATNKKRNDDTFTGN